MSGDELPTLAASVIIPAYNSAHTIDEQLSGFAEQQHAPPFEVILADNGSSDDTAEVAMKWADRIEHLVVVDASERRGPCAARNIGADHARADLLLYCDADDRVGPDWVAAMVSALADHDVVGGRLLIDELNTDVVRAWFAQPPDGLFDKFEHYLPYASGANLGIRRQVFDEIGGWDEAFTNGTDADFCFRAQLDGDATIGYAPDATVQYRHRGDLRGMCRNMRAYGRADAAVLDRYRPRGMQGRRPRAVARAWARTIVTAPNLLRGPERRGKWLRRFSVEVGRVQAGAKLRILV